MQGPARRRRRRDVAVDVVSAAAIVFGVLAVTVGRAPTPYVEWIGGRALPLVVDGGPLVGAPSAGRFLYTVALAKQLNRLELAVARVTHQRIVRDAAGRGDVEAAKQQAWVAAVSLAERYVPGGWPGAVLPARPDIDTGATRGRSLGLMVALSYLDAITAGDLTAGLVVAGTGTIDVFGFVGPVERVALKAPAAADAGASVFFAPTDAAGVAAASAPSMTVVAVDRLDDAVAWLCARGSTAGLCGPVLADRS